MNHKIAFGLVGVLTTTLAGAAFLYPKASGRRNMVFGCERPARLGVSLGDISPEKARELKLPGEYGAIVTAVEKDTPAAKAGLEENDVVLQFDGERVRSAAHLRRLVRETPPGRTVTLEVSRAGQRRRLDVQLESGPGPFFDSQFVMPPLPRIEIPPFGAYLFNRGAILGISADDLTSQLAAYFGVKQGKGVLVREVEAGGPAEKAGLKAGDCIVQVDSNEIGTVQELRRRLKRDLDGKRKVTLSIVRDRKEQTVTAELEAADGRWLPHVSWGLADLGIDPEDLCQLEDEVQAGVREAQEAGRKITQELDRARSCFEEARGQNERAEQELEENLPSQRLHQKRERDLLDGVI